MCVCVCVCVCACACECACVCMRAYVCLDICFINNSMVYVHFIVPHLGGDTVD